MFYIFDKDQTLTQSKSGKEFCNLVEDQELIPGVLEKLAEIREADPNAQFLIASNQGGVAFGYLTFEEANAMCQKALVDINGSLSVFCPEHPDGNVTPYNVSSQYRKPSPGMILYLMSELDADPSAVVYVGDMDTDQQAAAAAGIAFEWADDFFDRLDDELDRDSVEEEPEEESEPEPEASVRIKRIRGTD